MKNAYDPNIGRGGVGADFDWKQAVRVAAVGNVALGTLAPGVVIDGKTLAAGDRFLLPDQTDPKARLIYILTATSYEIASDSGQGKLSAGAIVVATEGNVNEECKYQLTTNDPIVVGTTDLTWYRTEMSTASLPVPDSTELVHDPVDPTRRMRIDTGAVATSTTRVLSMPNKDVTVDDQGDTRDPNAHGSAHKSAGADSIKLDELAAPTDVTTLNATTALHGLLPKLPGGPQQYLGGDGAWYDLPLSFSLFLATAASDIGGYKSLTPSVPAGGETSVSASIPGDDTEIAQWAATAVDTPRFINEQVMHIHLHINQSAGVKGSTLYAKIFHRTSGSTETLVGTSNTVIVPAVETDLELSVSVADTAFAETDRLVIKVYASPTGEGTDPTVVVYFEGTTYARTEVAAAGVAPTTHAASHASGGSDAIKLDDLATPDDNTDLNASTTAHGLAPKATAPSAGLLSVLGIANAETVRTDKALFDATLPAAVGTAAVGAAMVAARRDHVHDALPFVAVDGTLPTGANADMVASKLVYNKTCSDSDGDDVIDLHDGTIIGQVVTIHLGTKSGTDNAVITPVTKLGYSTITLDAVAELATLQWQGATVGWAILYASGTVA